MWKLFAVLSLVLNGQPVQHAPVEYINASFPTEQACKDFVASPTYKAAAAELKAYEEQQHAPAVVAKIDPQCKQGFELPRPGQQI